ncbi:MAG: STAS domain-containing protein [Leptolyngbya sp. Prado105]|nr:STAS domain-containing protein [Leptolyngbya sp. Prado105]
MNRFTNVVKLSGIFGQLQAKQFRQDISDLLDVEAMEILVDFEQVTFMDSSGLGALISVLKTVEAADARLALCSVRQEVIMLLELADVAQFFEIFPSQDAFYQAQANYSSDFTVLSSTTIT